MKDPFNPAGLRLKEKWTLRLKVPVQKPGPADGTDQYYLEDQVALFEVWGKP